MNIDQIGLANDLNFHSNNMFKKWFISFRRCHTAVGRKYKGKILGSHGITTTFSFHPRKIITTGGRWNVGYK